MIASVLQLLANAREKRVSLAAERRPVREKSPLGEDGCSSAARLVFVARAAGRYAVHTGLESASQPSPGTSSVRFPDRSQTTLNRSCNGGASRPARARLGPEVLQ